MAIKTTTFSINGSTYTLDKVSGTNKLKKQIQMPTKSSFSQPDHAYAALLKIIDEAGNVTSVDKTHPVYGELMKISERKSSAYHKRCKAIRRSIYHKAFCSNRIYGDR